MKKSEKEHLKEDPFKIFISSAIETIKESKRIFITGLLILIVFVVMVVAFLHFREEAQKKDNETFLTIVEIMNSKKNIDEKINALNKIEDDGGINGISKLNIASLYYMKKDYKKAKETIDTFSPSNSLLKEKKIIIKSAILNALNKKEEALSTLMPLSNKDNLEVPKDSILLNIAKLQIDLNKKKEAIKTLKRLIKDFPNSSMVNKYGRYGMPVNGGGEAKTLLKKLGSSLSTTTGKK